MNTPETIYYWDGVVLVSDQRLLFDSRSYSPEGLEAIAITELNPGEAQPLSPHKSKFIEVFLVIFLIGGLIFFLANPALLVSTILFVLAVNVGLQIKRHIEEVHPVSVSPKPLVYLLTIRGERGESKVFASLDKSYLQAIANCISERFLPASRKPASDALAPDPHSLSTPPASEDFSLRIESFYYDGIVDVNRDRVRLGSREYRLEEIESVGINEASSDAENWLGWTWLALGALAIAGQALSSLLPEPYHSATHVLVVAVAMLAFVIPPLMWFIGTSPGKTAYLLNIKRNGNVESALASLDKEYIQKIIGAIQSAKLARAPSFASVR